MGDGLPAEAPARLSAAASALLGPASARLLGAPAGAARAREIAGRG